MGVIGALMITSRTVPAAQPLVRYLIGIESRNAGPFPPVDCTEAISGLQVGRICYCKEILDVVVSGGRNRDVIGFAGCGIAG